MAGFHAASEHIKLGFLLLLGGSVLLLIGYFSPYWTVSPGKGHAGLWQGCMEDMCYDRWNVWVSPWIKACQAFCTMSMICTGFALVYIFIYIYHKDYELDRRLVFIPTCLAFATGLFLFLCWVIWAASTYYGSSETLSWCFAFIVLADLAISLSAICFLKEIRLPYTDYSRKLLEDFDL